MPASPEQAQRASATRAALVGAARELFTERGYFSTGTEDVVARAGVTRGALYHHFADKEDLFRAVFEAVSEDWLNRQRRRDPTGMDTWEQLRIGLQVYLDDAVTDLELQRILLLDGPAVLGWAAWRELGSRAGLAFLEAAINQAMEEGVLPPQPAGPLAHMLLAAVDEASLMIANSTTRTQTRDDVGRTLDALLSGLRSNRRP